MEGEGEDKKKKLERPVDLYDISFSMINLEEEDKIDDESKRLLANKRKRRSKIPLQIFKRKERRNIPESSFQKIFNELSKKVSVSRENIVTVAEDSRVKLDDDGINFFLELTKAKASMKKFGLPSDICKNAFHVYALVNFYQDTGVVTDDRVIWSCYYSNFTNTSEFKDMYSKSTLLDFSIVSDKIFACNDVKAGYCQDYFKNIAIINNSVISESEANTIKNDINNKVKGTKSLQLKLQNDATYNFFQYNSLIMAGKTDLDSMLRDAMKIKFFNTKNKLVKGLKTLKSNQSATYLNVVETKFTDFSPACLFTEPAIPKVRMFVKGELDTNTVYNTMRSKKWSSPLEIPLPSNAVFWDNINSFIQIIALYNLIENPSKALSKTIVQLVDIYYNNKEIFNAWRRVYKDFETLVIRFYESVSTKLTIDTVTNLDSKVYNFLSNYIYLKNNDRNFEQIRLLIGSIPRATLMNNFVSTNAPYELGMSISKLIVVLKAGKSPKEAGVKVDEMFRTLGLLCTKVFYGGTYQCIPKIRSYASFLGGPGGEMTNEEFTKNVAYLVDEFKKGLEKEGKSEEKKMFSGGLKKMNQIIDALIKNSEKKLNDSFINDNSDRLTEKIKSDSVLYNSLVDDVENMFENGHDESDIISYGDFLSNDLFNSFITAAGKLWNTASQVVVKPNVNEVIGALNITPGAKRGKTTKDFTDAEFVPENDLPVAPVVEINLTKLGKAGQGYRENVNVENVKKKLDDDLRTVVKKTRY